VKHLDADRRTAHFSAFVRVGDGVLNLLRVEGNPDKDTRYGVVRLSIIGGLVYEMTEGVAADTAQLMAHVAEAGMDHPLVKALWEHAELLRVDREGSGVNE
jgi:hypothetical protein